jgi:hypothetical protein
MVTFRDFISDSRLESIISLVNELPDQHKEDFINYLIYRTMPDDTIVSLNRLLNNSSSQSMSYSTCVLVEGNDIRVVGSLPENIKLLIKGRE